jgi:hypothetical protein
MNQIGRIKLMSKKLKAAEMNKLSIWLKDKAMVRRKEEQINEIISLGLGGRVVYIANSREYDVTGAIGSIINIRKKRNSDQYYVDVKFDRAVYKKACNVNTQDFMTWKYKKQEEDVNFYKTIRQKYGSKNAKSFRWEYWMQEEYRSETGKNPVETKIKEGEILIHISPLALKPATEENIASAQRIRDMYPMYTQLNKIISGQINEA